MGDNKEGSTIKIEGYTIDKKTGKKTSIYPESSSTPAESKTSAPIASKSSDVPVDTVSVNYSGVMDDVSNLLLSMKGTNFISDNASYATVDKSNADYFKSVDKGEEYLFNISNNMLYQMSIGANDVYTLLDNYSTQDASLASLASTLSDGFKKGDYAKFSSPDYQSNKVSSFSSVCNNNTDLFRDNLKEGTVGRVSNADLDGLIAKKRTSLNAEIEDSKNLTSSIDSMLNSPNIAGSGWDSFKTILSRYRYCNEIRGTAAETLLNAYEEATQLIKDFIGDDESLDDKEIPKYVDQIAKLKIQISNLKLLISRLERANASLANVKPTPIYTLTKRGVPVFVGWDTSAYDAAQAQIRFNSIVIATAQHNIEIAQEALTEAERYLAKLKELVNVMNKANKIINRALNLIESMYAKLVYNTDTPRLANLRDTGIDFREVEYTNDDGDTTKVWIASLADGLLPYLVLSSGLQDPDNPDYNKVIPSTSNRSELDPLVDNPLDLFEDAVLGVNGGRFRGAAYVNGEWYYTEGMEKEFADNGGQTLYMTVDGKLGVVENVDKNGNFIAEETIKNMHPPVAWATFGFNQFYGETKDGDYGYLDYKNIAEGGIKTQTAYDPRTFISQSEDGTISLYVAQGRGVDGNKGLPYKDMADLLKNEEYGASTQENPVVFGYNLDGGGSSVMKYVETNENGEPVTIVHHQPTNDSTKSSSEFPSVRDDKGKSVIDDDGCMREISTGIVVK